MLEWLSVHDFAVEIGESVGAVRWAICWSYTPPDGGGLAPLLPPPLFLGFSHSQSRVSVGLGRAAVPPQPLFGGDARGDDS